MEEKIYEHYEEKHYVMHVRNNFKLLLNGD